MICLLLIGNLRSFITASNNLLQTKREPTRTNAFTRFSAEFRAKHDVNEAVFLVDGATPLHDAYSRYGLNVRCERHGIRIF